MPQYIFFPPPQPTQPGPYVPIPTPGNQPPPGPQPAAVNAELIRQMWETPPPMPTQKLLLFPIPTPGNQPPITTPYAQAVLLAWRVPDPMPTQLPLLATTTTYPAVSQPPPYSIVLSTEIRRLWEPPDPQPQRGGPNYTPIPAQGQQPPPRTLYDAAVPQWQPVWLMPQALPANAGWNVPPILTVVPYFTLPLNMILAWQPPWVGPPALPNAPIPAQGQQPPSISNYPQAVLPSWIPPFVLPQTLAGNASWNFPPIIAYVPYTTLPPSILASWIPPFQLPQTLPGNASWNVPPINNPPPYSIAGIMGIVVQWWQPPPPLPQTLVFAIQPGVAVLPSGADDADARVIFVYPPQQGEDEDALFFTIWP